MSDGYWKGRSLLDKRFQPQYFFNICDVKDSTGSMEGGGNCDGLRDLPKGKGWKAAPRMNSTMSWRSVKKKTAGADRIFEGTDAFIALDKEFDLYLS